MPITTYGRRKTADIRGQQKVRKFARIAGQTGEAPNVLTPEEQAAINAQDERIEADRDQWREDLLKRIRGESG